MQASKDSSYSSEFTARDTERCTGLRFKKSTVSNSLLASYLQTAPPAWNNNHPSQWCLTNGLNMFKQLFVKVNLCMNLRCSMVQ